MGLYNSRKATLLLLAYISFFIAGIFFTLGGFSFDLSLYRLGQIFGTLSLVGLTMQLWMGARVKFLEKGVGLDKIMRFHSVNGRITFLFVFLHPLFMFTPLILKGLSVKTIISSYTIYHWMGVSAFWLIVLTLITTLYQARLKINYEHWKIIHRIGYLIIFLGFVHALFSGSDIVTRGPLYYYWWFLLILTVGAVIYRYGVRDYLLKDNIYEVSKVTNEAVGVRSILLKPLKSKFTSWFPGQFAFVKFYSKNVPSEEHHFTISSFDNGNVTFTVKQLGDYTALLGGLESGDKARLEGPFGVFSNFGMSGPFIFVAGGIGITPIMSMLRSMRDNNKGENTTLIYAAKTEGDLIFKKELDDLARRSKWFRVVYRVGDHISPELIKKEVNNFKHSKFFICGPILMNRLVEKLLLENGAQKGLIFTEKFSLK